MAHLTIDQHPVPLPPTLAHLLAELITTGPLPPSSAAPVR